MQGEHRQHHPTPKTARRLVCRDGRAGGQPRAKAESCRIHGGHQMNVIWNIASTTVGEAIRRRVLLVILLIGVLLLSIIPALGVLSARSETSITIGTMYAV